MQLIIEQIIELFILSTALNLSSGYKHFEVEKNCCLAENGKSFSYPLVDRLIRLILTLPVSTTTTERAFSAMKIVKTSLRNKMEDEFLSDYLIV
ncbi:hypothetical protein GQ457_02G033480 [Hibiscus cannabinus]